MIIKPPKRFQHSDENLMPMINIVFLLLVFFMVAGALQSKDAILVDAPESSAQSTGQLENQRLVVSADLTLGLGEEVFELDELQAVLDRAGLQDNIQVKADGRLTAAKLHQLMRKLREIGVKKIRLTGEIK